MLKVNENKLQEEIVIKELFTLREKKLVSFHENLIPNAAVVIGIRTPILRNYAKKLVKENTIETILFFIKNVSIHKYQELDYLISFLICYIDIKTEERISLLDQYSYTLNNWAACDMAVEKPTFKKKDLDKLFSFVKELVIYDAQYPYRNRFGLVFIMMYFTTDEYIDFILSTIDTYHYGEYYLDMGVAWLLSVLLVNNFDKTINYIKEKNNLNEFTYQKSLQKAIESFRISSDKKALCRELKKRGKLC